MRSSTTENNNSVTASPQSEIIPRLYMKLLPMQIVLVIIGGSNSIIDNAFAGNLIGADAMAVTGFFSPVVFFLNAVNALIFGGAQVLCGRYLGKKMVERTRSFFTLDMIMMMIISVALLVASEFFSLNVAAALGAEGTIAGELAAYIRGFALGLPFFCMGTQFAAFLQLEHQEKRSYTAVAVMFAANAFFNWLFVAVFDMGLFGLGLSTSVGNIIFFVIQGTYFLSSRAVIRFSRKSIVLSDIKDILFYGLPMAASQLCICLRGFFLNYIIQNYVGPDGLAAYSAIFSFGCIYWCFPAGVSSAVMVLGSVFAGEEDRTGLKILMKTYLTKGLGLVSAATLVGILLCYPFTNVFFHDPSAAVYAMTLAGFAIYPLYAPLSTIIVGFSNYFHCLSRERIVRILSVTDGIVGVCIFTYLLVPRIGMMGVWVGQVLGSIFNVLIIAGYIYLYNKRPPVNLDSLMCFDRGFGVSDESRIDITVHSMDDVMELSNRVWTFCKKHGLSGRRMYFSSLCTEELAGNIVTHGFADGKKHSIDIRVSYVNDEIMICFKDDGIPFNPEEAARLFESENAHSQNEATAFRNTGLQIVSRISRSMTYQNTFGLNILTIRV
ncbi:MAG: ATP-binding protein [Lachnospiraceae bacterium]|nr:ATP-binding protein [Lachnospiraceae bacterium]